MWATSIGFDASPTGRCRASGSRGSPTAPRCRRRSARRPSQLRESAPRAGPCRAPSVGSPDASTADGRASSASLEARCAFAEEGRDPLLGVLAGERRREAAASRPRCPRRGRPSPDTDLIWATASGACPASLRAHISAVSSSSWSSTTRFDEPELERFLGQDRVADEVHLERLVDADEPRQALRAAEAGDDAELDLGLAEERRARRRCARRRPSRARSRRRRRGR